MSVADRVVCMLEGRVVLEAATGVSVTREQITEAYFGLRSIDADRRREVQQ